MGETKLFDDAIHCFNQGEYFESHEFWEDLWHESSGARRHYLQGLIQLAAALHHTQNQNWVGANKLLATAYDHLLKAESADVEISKDLIIAHLLDVKNALDEKKEIPKIQIQRK